MNLTLRIAQLEATQPPRKGEWQQSGPTPPHRRTHAWLKCWPRTNWDRTTTWIIVGHRLDRADDTEN